MFHVFYFSLLNTKRRKKSPQQRQLGHATQVFELIFYEFLSKDKILLEMCLFLPPVYGF